LLRLIRSESIYSKSPKLGQRGAPSPVLEGFTVYLPFYPLQASPFPRPRCLSRKRGNDAHLLVPPFATLVRGVHRGKKRFVTQQAWRDCAFRCSTRRDPDGCQVLASRLVLLALSIVGATVTATLSNSCSNPTAKQYCCQHAGQRSHLRAQGCWCPVFVDLSRPRQTSTVLVLLATPPAAGLAPSGNAIKLGLGLRKGETGPSITKIVTPLHVNWRPRSSEEDRRRGSSAFKFPWTW
jgi:hypothetical protein